MFTALRCALVLGLREEAETDADTGLAASERAGERLTSLMARTRWLPRVTDVGPGLLALPPRVLVYVSDDMYTRRARPLGSANVL